MTKFVGELKSPWPDIPSEILVSIVDRLDLIPSEVQRLRAVCKGWASSIKPPCLCLSISYHRLSSYMNRHQHSYSSRRVPVPTAVYLLHPRGGVGVGGGSGGWLVGVEQCTRGKLCLVHPLTKLPIEAIPENFPKTISNIDATMLTKGFDFRLFGDIKHVDYNYKSRTKLFPVEFKVILWLDPRPRSLDLVSDHLKVIQLRRSTDGRSRKLIYWSKYNRLDLDKPVKDIRVNIEDIILWKSVIWAVDSRGRLYEIDYGSAKVNTITATANFIRTDMSLNNKRLLEYHGGLYMVVKCGDGLRHRAYLNVYKLNEFKNWEYMKSLEDKVLFLSYDTCFFARATDHLKSYRNCSVFPVNKDKKKEFGIGMCRYGEGKNFTMISPSSDLSNVIWPPPKWIMEHNTSTKPGQNL